MRRRNIIKIDRSVYNQTEEESMRDWKKRLIVAGVLLFGVIGMLVNKIDEYKKEAEFLENVRTVETEQALREALREDGWIYAKGKLSGNLQMKDVSLVNGELYDDVSKIPRGYKPVFFGTVIELEVKIGNYEYDKDAYESNRHIQHRFYAKKTRKLRTKTIGVLGMDFNVEKSENLLQRCDALRQRFGDGIMVKNADGDVVPLISGPEKDFYYRGYEAHACPSDIEGALKIQVKDGKVAEDAFEIIPAQELEGIEAMAAGEFDYATEIGAYIILWICLVPFAWLLMRFMGM